MIKYRHKKTGTTIERPSNGMSFCNSCVGDSSIRIPKEIVEESTDWERILVEVKTYPAELVEPLLSLHVKYGNNADLYNIISHLLAYKQKIQQS